MCYNKDTKEVIMMNFRIENWKLLVLSIFYLILVFLSFQITNEQLHNFFFVAGIVVACFGILTICAYFLKKDYLKPNEFSFSFGVMYILVGALIAAKPEMLVDNYPIAISAVVVWDSALRMQYAMNLLRLQKGNWVFTLLLAIATLAVGMILILVPNDEVIRLIVFRCLLIVDAIANFYTIIAYKIIVKPEDTTNTTQLLDIAHDTRKNEIMEK